MRIDRTAVDAWSLWCSDERSDSVIAGLLVVVIAVKILWWYRSSRPSSHSPEGEGVKSRHENGGATR